jgi:hypothetical protein
MQRDNPPWDVDLKLVSWWSGLQVIMQCLCFFPPQNEQIISYAQQF